LQASQKEETYSEQIRVLTAKHKEAEARAEFAERSVQKLQKEVDRLEDELRAEQERNKMLQEDMEATLQDIQNIWAGPRKGEIQGHLWRTRPDLRRDVRLLKKSSIILQISQIFSFANFIFSRFFTTV